MLATPCSITGKQHFFSRGFGCECSTRSSRLLTWKGSSQRAACERLAPCPPDVKPGDLPENACPPGRSWNEEERLKFLLAELTGRRPLLPPGLETTAEVSDVLGTFKVIAQLPADSLGAYVISMAHTASDVLAVVLLQVRTKPSFFFGGVG